MKKITKTVLVFFLISTTLFAQPDSDIPDITKDQVISDDLIVGGSLGVGMDISDGYSFGSNTIVLRENNLRILFDDTSDPPWANNDWIIEINSEAHGGGNYYRINDVSAGTAPFTIEAGAPDSALYVISNGNIYIKDSLGLGTANPEVDLHMVSGNSPALRIEQDGSSGFTSQSWDVGGNESNFFIRDVTNASKMPFRIVPGASNNSLFIAADGDIGFETSTPDGLIDVAHPDNANNHAFLIAPSGKVGVNIDNGEVPEHTLEVKGDAQVDSYFYFGDESTLGNWRVSVISGKLTFEKRETSGWVSKVEME